MFTHPNQCVGSGWAQTWATIWANYWTKLMVYAGPDYPIG